MIIGCNRKSIVSSSLCFETLYQEIKHIDDLGSPIFCDILINMKVLKFGAVWCAGCLVMKPRWRAIEKEHPWFISEYFEHGVDTEAFEKYNVQDTTLPTFVFLDKNDNEITRLHGEVPKKEIVKVILYRLEP